MRVGQEVLVRLENQDDVTKEISYEPMKIDLIDTKCSMVKLVPIQDGEPRYFKLPYFEWLLYTGEIRYNAETK